VSAFASRCTVVERHDSGRPMSLVSSGVNLTHSTTVQRDANADTVNAAGAQESPDWADHITDLPCRAWTNAGREQFDATTSVVVEDMRCIVDLGTDVTEQDRLNGVTDAYGQSIIDGLVSVRAVITRKDHLELILVRIS